MRRLELIEKDLIHAIIGSFFDVYNTLGFGFLERLYVSALEKELVARRHRVAREVCVRVSYKGQVLGIQRLDMVVDERVVVEVMASAELHRAATRQLYNYLRATNLEVGLLLHFGHQPAFHRVLYRHPKSDPERSTVSGASV